MLEVRGLRVAYGPVLAVGGVDLDVSAGEAVALLGPNGAGKTSALAAVTRSVRSEGTVRFEGVDLGGWTPERVARAGLILVPEGRHVFPNLTVLENLQVATSARAGRPPVVGFDEVFDLFPPLVPLRRRAGWALSGGEQQMVAIGRALLGAPRLLLLDEPSLGLAPVVSAAVFDALAEVRDRVALLLVEQNTALALSLCDRAYVLAEGEVVLAGDRSELSDRGALIDSYLGQRNLEER
jgi:branched-chain amino acid transport system ATP-binding protein